MKEKLKSQTEKLKSELKSLKIDDMDGKRKEGT